RPAVLSQRRTRAPGSARRSKVSAWADTTGSAELLNSNVELPTSSWPGLSRPSSSLMMQIRQDVDVRHKAGHDGHVDLARHALPTFDSRYRPDRPARHSFRRGARGAHGRDRWRQIDPA